MWREAEPEQPVDPVHPQTRKNQCRCCRPRQTAGKTTPTNARDVHHACPARLPPPSQQHRYTVSNLVGSLKKEREKHTKKNVMKGSFADGQGVGFKRFVGVHRAHARSTRRRSLNTTIARTTARTTARNVKPGKVLEHRIQHTHLPLLPCTITHRKSRWKYFRYNTEMKYKHGVLRASSKKSSS